MTDAIEQLRADMSADFAKANPPTDFPLAPIVDGIDRFLNEHLSLSKDEYTLIGLDGAVVFEVLGNGIVRRPHGQGDTVRISDRAQQWVRDCVERRRPGTFLRHDDRITIRLADIVEC